MHESASGPDSILSNTNQVRDLIKRTVNKKVSSILDLGSVDWNWMSHTIDELRESQPIDYIRWDLNEKLINELIAKHREKGHFLPKKLSYRPLPKCRFDNS
jgi:hypothetical protein